MCGTPISAAEPTRPGWTRLGPPDLLGGRTLMPMTIAGRSLLLVRDGARIVATERACPHEGADLSLGRCAGGRLHCPRHLASFALTDGSVSPGWAFRGLRVYAVEVDGAGMWVRPEEPRPSS
jgi:3-phenylpropionate/trans-cinnamate dioxygenase ferredoxin component